MQDKLQYQGNEWVKGTKRQYHALNTQQHTVAHSAVSANRAITQHKWRNLSPSSVFPASLLPTTD